MRISEFFMSEINKVYRTEGIVFETTFKSHDVPGRIT
jgi:hypothetical protein